MLAKVILPNWIQEFEPNENSKQNKISLHGSLKSAVKIKFVFFSSSEIDSKSGLFFHPVSLVDSHVIEIVICNTQPGPHFCKLIFSC